MDEEEPFSVDLPEEDEQKPPKEDIRIIEISESGTALEKVCRVCGQLKPVYVEIESDGVVEHTCKECFEKDVTVPGKACRECEEPVSAEDAFCGKCGTPAERKCEECGALAQDDDAFCGKCGSKL